MMNYQLTKEDIEEIKILTREIISKDFEVTYDRFIGSKKNYDKLFVGADDHDFEGRKMNERFSFFTQVEAGWALYNFFHNLYNAKHIAKMLYLMDEDEKFTEQYDAQIPLGRVMTKDGKVETTSVCEMVLKKRNPEKRNGYFGMPFDIIMMRLIPASA